MLRRLAPRERVAFQDISPPDAAESCPLPRETLLARFHVQCADGRMIDGAEAFTEAWSRVRGLGWLRPVGRYRPARTALNGVYAGFRRIRPSLQKLVRRMTSRRA